ncbi:PLP-dependent aminotransferase family protein [Herpetosiphon sp. NSE202]|uniref:MocR-like pyridoxine biosynthesis transcription factor PdxR n=1 Tax=Herpetosiphon sp. NSE202 TaxID=3351349 RepID=UPI0036438C86
MLAIPLNPNLAKPLYLQIADHVTALARSGQLQPEQRLPSSRQLAEQLNLHRSTVVTAFDELRARGIIQALHGSGSYICVGVFDQALQAPATSSLTAPALGNDQLIAELWRLNHAEGMISLALGVPAPDMFPSQRFALLQQRIARRDPQAAWNYTHPQGFYPLRQAIAHDLARHGIQTSAEQLIITNGANEAINLVTQALAVAGDNGLIEEPSFHTTLLNLQQAGIGLAGFGIDQQGPHWASLEAALGQRSKHPRFVLVTPDFHNPSGMRWNSAQRYQFLNWANQQAIPIIEDATYSDLGLTGPSQPALRAFDSSVIYLGSYSKSLMPGLRIGFIVANGLLLQQLVSLKTITSGSNESFSQQILAEYLHAGEYHEHVEWVTSIYQRRRDALLNAVQRYLPSEVQATVADGGFYSWLSLPAEQPIMPLFQRALQRGVVIFPGQAFYLNQPAEQNNCIRLCFARYPEDVLTHGVRLLGSCF